MKTTAKAAGFLFLLAGCQQSEPENPTTNATFLQGAENVKLVEPAKQADTRPDIELATAAAFPSGLKFTYQNAENAGCNGYTARARVQRLTQLDNGHEALVSTVGFSSDVPHVCMGFIQIDTLQRSEDGQYRAAGRKEIYTNGFGQPTNEWKLSEHKGRAAKLTIEGGYTGQGYTTLSIATYELTSSGTRLVSEKTSCVGPDGRETAGAC